MAKDAIKMDFREVRERSCCFRLSSAELRQIVLDGLKRRGVDTDGNVAINYYGNDCNSTSSPISAGPAIQVTIRQSLPK